MQNSLVTQISASTVRTTHLTGLFTDLGIELSQLFFHNKEEHRKLLWNSIKLRLTIILFFFAGGVFGGHKDNLLIFSEKMKEKCIQLIEEKNIM